MSLKEWKVNYEYICWDRALVLWKNNLPGRGLTKVEKHCYKLPVRNSYWWWTITCSKHVEDNLSEIDYSEKVCIFLVFLTYVNILILISQNIPA